MNGRTRSLLRGVMEARLILISTPFLILSLIFASVREVVAARSTEVEPDFPFHLLIGIVLPWLIVFARVVKRETGEFFVFSPARAQFRLSWQLLWKGTVEAAAILHVPLWIGSTLSVLFAASYAAWIVIFSISLFSRFI